MRGFKSTRIACDAAPKDNSAYAILDRLGRVVFMNELMKGLWLTTETFFDKKEGKTKMLQRPRLTLDKAVVFDGGLGPAKKEDVAGAAPVDNAEVIMPTA